MDRLAILRLRRARTEEGMTLVEVLVAMFIMSIVVLVFTNVLASVQRGVAREDSLSQTLDQARLALQQIDREMRSGNVLYDPALENAPGGVTSCSSDCQPQYTLRVYTQSNADTRAVSGTSGYRCVLWKISGQKLMTRWWPPLDPSDASTWRVVATGIVNRDLSPKEPAFALDSDPLKGGRTLNIKFAVNSDLTHRSTQTARIQASLTGRNTSYGYPGNVCLQTPAG
jgi:prepilin-type N-terminal cleavage/methylation domain-containing protein